MLHPLYENKNCKNLNVRNFLSHVTFDLHAYHGHTRSLAAGAKCKASSLNNVSLPRHRNGVTFLILVDRYQHRFSPAMIKEQPVMRKCERYQLLRMHVISHSKHTKLNYSKGVFINYTKISTNKNFPLYGTLYVMWILIIFIVIKVTLTRSTSWTVVSLMMMLTWSVDQRMGESASGIWWR